MRQILNQNILYELKKKKEKKLWFNVLVLHCGLKKKPQNTNPEKSISCFVREQQRARDSARQKTADLRSCVFKGP